MLATLRLKGADPCRSIGIVAVPDGPGYAIADNDGSVVVAGESAAAAAPIPTHPAVGAARAATGGFWVASSDGGVTDIGAPPTWAPLVVSVWCNRWWASVPARPATATGSSPPTAASSASATPTSTARPAPSTSTNPSSAWPPRPTGNGYWLVASDGGIFSFGDARFYGSTGAIRLNQPVVGMAATPTATATGSSPPTAASSAFGDAHFYGSGRRSASAMPVTGIGRSPSGNGYRIVAADGGVLAFGDANA